ncbi:translation elongation factor Ts [Verrucomicrobia bacterium]|nr:translation elongation factor Ts [Verrucomicrobiota bacterium]
MADIKASDVSKLRQATGAGMMDCKKALTESNGDFDNAVDYLRLKGTAAAGKKAGRAANEGVIAQGILPDAKTGVIVEINCETDFVAKNPDFQSFCSDLAGSIAADPAADIEALRTAQVAVIGENIIVPRHARLVVEGNGLVAGYIHTGGKVGVLVEVGCGKAESPEAESFKQLVRDITLQIAAASPVCVRREEMDQKVVEKERALAAEMFKDKPAAAIENILKGKMEKFFQEQCLVDQGFVKENGDIAVKDVVAKVAKELGDEIEIRSFIRYQVGESAE